MADTRQKPLIIDYPRSSFLDGMARLLDFGGTLNQYDAAYFEELAEEIRSRWLRDYSEPGADAEAIHESWVEVGNSLRRAMGMPLVDPSKKRKRRMEARRHVNEQAE